MIKTSNQTEPVYSAFGSDPDLGPLVELYVSEMPDRIRSLEEAYASRNWEDLRRVAHQMKGSAGSYGFDCLTPLAYAVEVAARQGDDETAITEALTELLRVCRSVRAGTPD